MDLDCRLILLFLPLRLKKEAQNAKLKEPFYREETTYRDSTSLAHLNSLEPLAASKFSCNFSFETQTSCSYPYSYAINLNKLDAGWTKSLPLMWEMFWSYPFIVILLEQ